MKRKAATTAQFEIARSHDIPLKLASTINIKKCEQYQAWLRTPHMKLQKFLDNLEIQRWAFLRDELLL